MKKLFIAFFTVFIFLIVGADTQAQTLSADAEKIRTDYEVPEIAYAVVSADSVLEMKYLGVKRIGTNFVAEPTDRFHLGSNTKAITGFVAALLVKEGKLNWDTKFFALFPELKSEKQAGLCKFDASANAFVSRAASGLYLYEFAAEKEWFKGEDAAQRRRLAEWFLQQKPQKATGNLFLTNAGYVLAGLMLERASGKSYKELIADFGKRINVNFNFDYPNLSDYQQTWGHDANLNPLTPHSDYKLNWLLSAGNINANLADYATFVQLQLKGLKGNSDLLSKKEFEFLHFGAKEFSVGWFWKMNENNHPVSSNTGNAGAFVTQVYVIPEIDRAYILFANSASEKTSEGLQILFDKLTEKYGK